MGSRGGSFEGKQSRANKTTSDSVKAISLSNIHSLILDRLSGAKYSEDEAKSVEKLFTDMKVGTRLEVSGESGYKAIFEKVNPNEWLRDNSADDTRDDSGLARGVYGGKLYSPTYTDIKKSDTYSPKKAERIIKTIENDFTNNRSVVTKMGSHYQIDLYGKDATNTKLRNKLRKCGFTESSDGIWRR